MKTKKLITYEEAKNKLPYIEDKNLYKSVLYALSLITIDNVQLKESINRAKIKYGFESKRKLETTIKKGLPQHYFAQKRSFLLK